MTGFDRLTSSRTSNEKEEDLHDICNSLYHSRFHQHQSVWCCVCVRECELTERCRIGQTGVEGTFEDASVLPSHDKQGLVLWRHTQTGGCREVGEGQGRGRDGRWGRSREGAEMGGGEEQSGR